jgi:hypothetical protein
MTTAANIYRAVMPLLVHSAAGGGREGSACADGKLASQGQAIDRCGTGVVLKVTNSEQSRSLLVVRFVLLEWCEHFQGAQGP